MSYAPAALNSPPPRSKWSEVGRRNKTVFRGNSMRREQKNLHVCSLSAVPDAVHATGADALVSVLHPELTPATPTTISPSNHFKLAIDDIDAPFEGLRHAEREHVQALCTFAKRWHESARDTATMVVHCYVGVSRSTAAAFVILCALNPETDPQIIANYLRHQSATASPNRLIVEIGDDVLGHRGRMSRAIRTIGQGDFAQPVRPFGLNIHPDAMKISAFSQSKAA